MDRYFAQIASPYGTDQPYVSLILNATENGDLEFSGRVYDRGEWFPVTRLSSIGPQLQRWRSSLLSPVSPPDPRIREILLRWTQVVGDEKVATLTGSRVGIVGGSGTGSPAIEMLARACVGGFAVIDPKRLAISNLERVHESKFAHVFNQFPPYKAQLMRDMIHGINPGADVCAIVGNALSSLATDELLRCDVVIGASDSLHARAWLGDLATQYLVPVIDVGVLIEGEGGQVPTQMLEIARYSPGDACPYCLSRVCSQLLNEELMPAEEAEMRRQQAIDALKRGEDGHAYWRGGVAQLPSVGYLTTVAGALAAGYALNWLLGSAQMPHQVIQADITRQNFAFVGTDGTPRPHCACVRSAGHADQGAPSVTMPRHWPRSFRLV